MRIYRDGANVVLETVITDSANKFTAELSVDKISILNTSTGLYEVFEMLWSDIKDINNASLVDAAATKDYLDSLFKTKGLEIDGEGRQTVRRAIAKKGWHYSAITAEVETSKTETYNKDHHGVDLGFVTVKLYDISDVEITVPANYGNAVKTVVNIKPDYDFEVIEGDIFQHTRPIDDIRLWTLGGIPELGAAGTKVFVNGINLKFMSPDDHIKSDGRSSKFMAKDVPGLPYQGNQFEFILKHPAGVNHQLMILLETYKA